MQQLTYLSRTSQSEEEEEEKYGYKCFMFQCEHCIVNIVWRSGRGERLTSQECKEKYRAFDRRMFTR